MPDEMRVKKDGMAQRNMKQLVKMCIAEGGYFQHRKERERYCGLFLEGVYRPCPFVDETTMVDEKGITRYKCRYDLHERG